jgi:hypothetical protein
MKFTEWDKAFIINTALLGTLWALFGLKGFDLLGTAIFTILIYTALVSIRKEK